MTKKDAWNAFIESEFFKHINYREGSYWDSATINKFLESVNVYLYSKEVALEYEDVELSIPNIPNRGEAIGYNTEKAKTLLKHVSEPSGEGGQWIQKYLNDVVFKKYVDELMEFLSKKAQSVLPSMNKSVGSIEERRRDNERDFAEDVKSTTTKFLEAKAAAENAESQAKKAQSGAQEAQKAAESIMPNMLTTLGVFVAIIIAVVAAYLSLLLSQHQNEAKPLNLAICLLMGHILLNVIFLLLYLISKMTYHSIACNCPVANIMDCSECGENDRKHCHMGNKIWFRYPYVVLLNGVFIFAYAILLLWNFAEAYLYETIDSVLEANPKVALVALIVSVIVVILFIVIVVVTCGKPRWKDNDKEGKKEIWLQCCRVCIENKRLKVAKREAKAARIRGLERAVKKLEEEVQAIKTKNEGPPTE